MKTFITLLLVVVPFTASYAQLGKKANLTSPVKTIEKAPVAKLNEIEMSLIANTNATNIGFEGLSLVDKEVPKGTSESGQIAADAAKKMVDQTIFGDNSPKTYGISYWSGPVLRLYTQHVTQKLPELIEANDDKWNENNQGLNKFIAGKVADQLVLAATTAGAYVNTFGEMLKGGELGPETLELLKSKTKEHFKTQTWTGDYQQPYYFKNDLMSIHNQMPRDYVTEKSNGMTYTDNPAHTRGFFFMASFGSSANCALAVIIAKSDINVAKIKDKYTDMLDNAKWGLIFRYLLEYKNQSSFFTVHQVSMDWLQAITAANEGAILFDKENNCPSETAFDISQKIRSASVFNSAKF